MVQSINAITFLHNDQKSDKFPYFLTGRLNQDALENLFSRYRQKGGYNRNPTVTSFMATFKNNSVINLMKPAEGSNCEENEDEMIFHTLDKKTGEISDSDSVNSLISSEVSSASSRSSANLEECSLTYFAGYLIRQLLNKFQCELCKKRFLGKRNLNDKKQVLLLHKNYGTEEMNLKVPLKSLVKLCKFSMRCIDKYWQKFSNQNLIRMFEKHIFNKYVLTKMDNVIDNLDCLEHVKFLVRNLIIITINKKCKYYSTSLRQPLQKTSKTSSKIQILKNL